MTMFGYIAKRFAGLFPFVLFVIVLNFTLIQLAPGDAISFLISDANVNPEYLELAKKEYGLDKPLYTQLGIYIWKAFQLDFGYSFFYHRPVFDVIIDRLQATLTLTIAAFFITVLFGLSFGVIASKRPHSITDSVLSIGGLIVYGMPSFWTAMVFIIIFGHYLGLFPVYGMVGSRLEGWDYILDVGHHLVLPALSLGLGRMALYMRLTRASMLEEIRNDYVLTAWSKGSDENRVFYKHVLRNALVPVVTMMGIEARLLFSGALLTETVFAWPGIGRLVYESILRRDQNIVLSVFVVISVIVYFANWLADITYSYLDPRIRKSS